MKILKELKEHIAWWWKYDAFDYVSRVALSAVTAAIVTICYRLFHK